MRMKVSPGAMAAPAAGGLALAALSSAAPALAAPITVNLPCSTGALSGAISSAVSGDVLQLATNCTYLLHSALPQVTVGLTIQGSPTSTIERGYPGSLPLLWVGTSDGLTVSNVNLKNGDAPYGGAIYGKSGPVTGNAASYRGGGIYNTDALTIRGTTLQQNTASSGGGGLYNTSVVDLNDSKVLYNHAPAGEGGGIYNGYIVNLTNTTVRFNTANNCSPSLSVSGCTG